jgi:hypothetical protein
MLRKKEFKKKLKHLKIDENKITMNKFNKFFKEAIDVGPVGKFYNPQKLAEDETAEDYMQMLYSQNYQKVIERLSQYSRTPIEQLGNYPIERQVVEMLQRILRIEGGHKERLEQLAVKTVLDLPEMKSVKALIEQGILKIDAKLSSGELQRAITDIEAVEREAELQDEQGNPTVEGDNLTDAEKTNIALAMDIMGAEEIKERKSFADAIKFGEAFNHLYSYNLVRDQIDELNPELADMYGIVSSIVQVLYYYSPSGGEGEAARTPNAALGSAEAEPEGRSEEGYGKYTIKARGMTFPFLVHEIIKGIMQWNNQHMDELRNVQKTSTLEDESRKMRYAQALVKRVIDLIPDSFVKHKNLIYQEILSLPIEDMKEIEKGGPRSRDIIKDIIDTISQEFDLDPETGEEKEEEYKDQQ